MLTDEKIEALWRSIHHGKHMATGFNTFARVIEAAVREEMVKQGPVAWLDLTRLGRTAIECASSFKVNDRQTPLYAAPVIPDGMVMVPREPSEAMIEAAQKERMGIPKRGLKILYNAVIAAAEKQNAR